MWWWWVWLWCVDDSTTHGPIHLLLNTAGPKAIARNALVGGILLALIEGVGIMIQKFSAEQMQGNATTPQSLSLLSDCLTDDVVPCPLPLFALLPLLPLCSTTNGSWCCASRHAGTAHCATIILVIVIRTISRIGRLCRRCVRGGLYPFLFGHHTD